MADLWLALAACRRDTPEPRPAPVEVPAPVPPGTTPTALPAGCGDGSCGDGEVCGVCPVDCGPCPAACDADGACEGRLGETCPGCPADCDTAEAVCGNGACDDGEDPVGCMVDCGPAVWPVDWATAESAVVAAINARRAAGGACPSGSTGPVSAVADDPTLRAAARGHAWVLALTDDYGERSCNGRTLGDRAPGATGETLGFGWPTPDAVVAAWARLPGDCETLFDPTLSRVGVGFASVGGDPLWVATFR